MSILAFAAWLFYFNLLTLGKGLLMIPLIQGHLVEGAQVLTGDQLLMAVAIGQVTPGPGNIYVAAVGYLIYGLPGAVVALVAVVLPSFGALALTHGYQRLKTNRIAQGFFKGLTTTALGLIFYSALLLAREAITSGQALAVLILGFVLIQFVKVNPILSLLAASLFGLVLHFALG
ncbi:MAG: chromate transporter [Chloroflexi bacterium]|nr:chromate transporter [Chloroflexota bacterium]